MDNAVLNVIAAAECLECKRVDSVKLSPVDWDKYITQNKLVQDVWPDLGMWDREVIIGCRSGFYQCALCSALLESLEEA